MDSVNPTNENNKVEEFELYNLDKNYKVVTNPENKNADKWSDVFTEVGKYFKKNKTAILIVGFTFVGFSMYSYKNRVFRKR